MKQIKLRPSAALIKNVEDAISQYKNRQSTTRGSSILRSPFEKQQRERDEHIRTQTIEMMAKVADMLDENMPFETISNKTGFEVEHVKKIQQLLRKKG